MIAKWSFRPTISKKVALELKDFPEMTKQLLFARGIKTAKEAQSFLIANYETDVHDPFLLSGMTKAVRRIKEAISRQEKILIFGDYDADGVPGTAILSLFFREIGFKNFEVYIPDRHLESYGLSLVQVENFAEAGVNLLITIDCGITSVAEVALAKKLGIDVIVTDHHLPQAKVPKALAIINPKIKDDKYPFKELCGAGVIFKVVQALLAGGDWSVKIGFEKWLLDLVAISTVADMMTLSGENRALVKFGLIVLNKTRRLGLLELLRVLKIKYGEVNEGDIGFMIGPRINSASRMTHGIEAYKLLTTTDASEARTIALQLEKNNQARKKIVEEIMQTVSTRLTGTDIPPVIVIGDPTWGLGVLGLSASKIVEKYQRPAFVWGKNGDDVIKGSCRSDGSVNLVELMTLAGGEKFFTGLGGHVHAGGFSLSPEKVGDLEKKLIDAYKKADKQEVVVEELIDAKLNLADVAWETYSEIEKLAPFGLGNPKPTFLFENIEIDKVRTFGNGGIHLELGFKVKGKFINAIGFFTCSPSEDHEDFHEHHSHHFVDVALAPGRRVDLLATFDKSTFGRIPELRLRIVDVRSVV
jgi:single-stranded-DNA-specific exonuclease